MKTIVFLGPTLPIKEARKIMDADYRPPAQMSSIYVATKETPDVIALIDGRFESVAAVWHKEILYAIQQGIIVFGASSMGALRAAELHSFGMMGVGRIFELYRDNVLTDDDEVALIHATEEFGYRALSEPMINIRDALRSALELQIIRKETHDLLLSEMKQRFYWDRSWEAAFAAGCKFGLPENELQTLSTWVEQVRPNLKRDDAIELLQHLANGPSKVTVPDFHFEPTCFWKMLTITSRTSK